MNAEDLIKEWRTGKAWVDGYTRDFKDLENLADGVSLHDVKGAPVVGEVTLAQSIRQIPQASIQNVPELSAEINGTKLSTDAIVANFLLRREIFNEDTFGAGILSKLQLGAESALTHGFQAFLADTTKVFSRFGTTLQAVHYNDLVIEAGVFDGADSSFYQIRTRVTKAKLKDLYKSAKSNPDTLWNVEALKELIEAGPNAENYNNSYSNPRSVGNNDTASYQYDIITRYGVGPEYTIDIFSPQITDKVLMSTKSLSKFGFPRVTLLVIDPAQLTPFGISRARLASPMANYANIYLQSTAKMQLINADPPTFKKGLFTTPTPFKRRANWESQDPNADARLMELSNSTLQQFNEVMNFTSNQIQAMMGVGQSNGTTNSSVYRNKAQVEQSDNLRSLGSAQVTAILEQAIRQYALTALDLYLSEQTVLGETSLIIDDEAKNAINQIEGDDFVGDDNVINVDWKATYDRIQTMTVSVDLSMAKKDMEEKKRADLQDMLTVQQQMANPNDPMAMARINAISDELLQNTVPDVAKELQNEYQQQPQPNAQFEPQTPASV